MRSFFVFFESVQNPASDSNPKAVAPSMSGNVISENSDVAGVIKMLDQARERLTEMKGGAILSDEEDEENIAGFMKRGPQYSQTLGIGTVELINFSPKDPERIIRKGMPLSHFFFLLDMKYFYAEIKMNCIHLDDLSNLMQLLDKNDFLNESHLAKNPIKKSFLQQSFLENLLKTLLQREIQLNQVSFRIS